MAEYAESAERTSMSGAPVVITLPEDWGYIRFQDGAVKEAGRNGAFIEDIIQILVDRLEYYNTTEFRCRENSLAITHLEEALHWLWSRTKARQEQGVEGRNLPHKS